jgi:serine/threonine protein kinase
VERTPPEGPRERPSLSSPGIPALEREFVFERELGRGGSSVVYLARPRSRDGDAPDGPVALKLVRPEHRSDEDAVARLVREARMLGELQHPGILRLEGTRRVARHHLALLLEYVPGRTLQDRLRQAGPLPVREVTRIMGSLVQTLVYLHRHRVVHRDLKPGNIYLDEAGGRVLLADFGIARHWDGDAGLDASEGSHGTPAYMSPEQVEGRPLDGRSDLYALGLVAFEMLTGRSPWSGAGLSTLLARRKAEDLPPSARLRPGLPPGLARGIDRCLRTDPEERWPDARALLEALQDPRPLTPEEWGEGWVATSPESLAWSRAWEEAPTIRYHPGMELPPAPPELPGSAGAQGVAPPSREARPAGVAPGARHPAGGEDTSPEPPRAGRRTSARTPVPGVAVAVVGLLLAAALALFVFVL